MDVRVVLAGLFVFPWLCETGYQTDQQPSEHYDRTNTTRVKRVFYGEPLLDRNSYDVMKYIVYITNGACGSGYLGRIDHALLGICDPPIVGWGLCGGSLISEYTVQTACHCIVYWTTMNDTHFKNHARSVWENQFVMYMGYSDVTKMKDGSRAIMLIQHQNCIKVRSDPLYFRGRPDEGGHTSHDFGLIFGRTPLVKKHRLTREAPTYAVSEMRRMFKRIQFEESVCLVAGWGTSRLIKDAEDEIARGVASRSPFLQHAWVRLLSYQACARSSPDLITYLSFLRRTGFEGHRNYTYQGYASWVCSKRFGKMSGSLGRGDSGSPLTCDNKYVALAYGSKFQKYLGNVDPYT